MPYLKRKKVRKAELKITGREKGEWSKKYGLQKTPEVEDIQGEVTSSTQLFYGVARIQQRLLEIPEEIKHIINRTKNQWAPKHSHNRK